MVFLFILLGSWARISFMRIVFIFLFLLLSACVTERVKNQSAPTQPASRYAILHDSAPSGPHPAAFKSIHPKAEPLSHYGNPARYQVDGKEYRVMATAKGYKSRGLASWYGVKFHKQRTSSGDAYDMYAMTAAHKTLPLPTYVKVKNLSNGRTATVKVNDRGPFHSDRLIDLSYAAATQLGILPQGTALVEIEAISPPGAPILAHYYLQAGAFSNKENAELTRKKIKTLALLTYALKPQLLFDPEKGQF